jgi:phage terminase large subunit
MALVVILVRRKTVQQLVNRSRQDPVWFVREVLQAEPWSKQVEILESIRDHPRTAVRSCHGVGKSFTAGQAILWFLFSLPSIVLSTAPTWRQVEKLVWKEVRASYARAKIPLGGTLLPASPELHVVRDQWYATGLSTNDPDRFQGYHEKHILVIVDEAAGVPEPIHEAIEGVLTSEHARLLLLGNPTAIGGTFHKAFTTPGWRTIHVGAFDTPNFTAFGITEEDIADGSWKQKITGELPNPKLITPNWVADKYRSWGPDSPAYQARVMGNFPTSGDDTLIPLAWIEAAMARWEDEPEGEPVEIGADIARFGSDKTVFAPRRGHKVLPLTKYSKQDTMETAGQLVIAHRETLATSIKVDVIGIGAGVYDRAKELKLPVSAINVAESAQEPERFLNLRSELWWNLRELLDPNPAMNPNPVALPPDDELLADLSSVKYRIDSRGRIVVEPKEETKKRLGRSPDRADAVILAFAPTLEIKQDPAAVSLLRGIKVYG